MEKSMENRERLKEQQGTEAGSLECSCLFLAISTLTTDRGSKGAEGRTEEVASLHRLKCSRVYRKPLQKSKEKQLPIPQTHTTDGIPFTSRRDSATNSSFRATKSHSVLAVWSLGVKPSTSSHLSVTSSVGSGVSA